MIYLIKLHPLGNLPSYRIMIFFYSDNSNKVRLENNGSMLTQFGYESSVSWLEPVGLDPNPAKSAIETSQLSGSDSGSGIKTFCRPDPDRSLDPKKYLIYIKVLFKSSILVHLFKSNLQPT
jgi:hypothetical protein